MREGEARRAYAERSAAAAVRLVALDRAGARLANLRTVAFLGLLAILLLVIFERLPRAGLFGALACFGAYLVLAVIHARVLHDEAKATVKKALNDRGLGRLDGQWHTFPSTGVKHLGDGHLYAADLDVFGQGSVFQRIDDTGTLAGETQLAAWLKQAAPSVAAIAERQAAVRELTPLLDFRQALITEARMAGAQKADPSRFIAWAEADSGLGAIRWAYPLAHLLAPATVVLGLLSAMDVVGNLPFLALLGVQLVVVLLTRRPLGRMYEALQLGERGFVRFEETFHAIAHERLSEPYLQALQRGLEPGQGSVPERLQQFARLMGFAALRQSGQLHPLINLLTLWDILVLFRVEAWRVANGRGVRKWFEALAQLEALSSFAGFAFERPDFTYPQLVEAPLTFEATQLRHPLLESPVANDVRLRGPGSALVITGSNMSGKTTLMRAMGLNAVLALAGLPVAAGQLRLSRVQVLTSMRVKDSLERGVSYFYAEVQRIRTLLDAAKLPLPCLFFLDELFMGTNTKERQIASKHVLRLLLDAGSAGAITTHDLSLCELAQERPEHVENVHFRDHMTQGQMHFDYALRPGVVQTTNALEVLRQAGVPVPTTES